MDPDPLLFLYDYPEKKNREIAGLIAACFAYGRVDQIMKTVGHILEKLCPSPYEYLLGVAEKEIANDFKGFRYRFASESHLVNFLWGIKNVLNEFESLENCFYSGHSPVNETVLPGLVFFSGKINKNKKIGHLMADPEKKSACKRSLLFLRWMVRKDLVDPGGWKKISPSQLIVPIDTHMYKTGRMLEFTRRKSPDMKTALEITRGFRKILSCDPVKYDFSLTRFGIRKGLNMDHLKDFILG
ncbi:MAG: TIGR02757 family protein [Deltaproteobacteria bacterium]|nr:TIGR02757 family protein [Deltaproteobacteria bacterium]